MNCDLCNKAVALEDSLLCADCAQAVGRVMQVEQWAVNRATDKQRNAEQERLLKNYLSARRKNA